MNAASFYYNEIWKKTLQSVLDSKEIDDYCFETFFRNTHLLDIVNDEALISVPSFVAGTIINQHAELIKGILEELISQPVTLQVISEENLEKQKEESSFFISDFIRMKVDSSFTFTNFVVGKSNIQAQNASMICASNPGLVYNPLFIYGSSGLGKTHLLNAIGNHVAQVYPNLKIGFITALDFVDAVSKARSENKFNEFKASFKELDVLLVDDIQFIGGNKEKSQELFFTIFNDLVNNKKQICLTADCIPSEIKGLEERIISRFNQGLNVNIEAPEYETSINILKMKLEGSQQKIDDEVLDYLAANFSQDVRSLEGAVNRLLFYSISFSKNGLIDLDLAKEAFKDQLNESSNALTAAKIKNAVCDYYNITKQQLVSSSRQKNIAIPRHIAMYLCRKLLDMPYKTIGNEFGKRDHTTVMSACEKIDKLLSKDALYKQVIADIESRI